MKEKEFTKNNLLLIEQCIISLKKEKNNVVEIKTRLESNLRELSDKYSDVIFNSKEFLEIKKLRKNLKTNVTGIEARIRKINNEIAEKNKLKLEVEFYLNNNRSLEGKEDLEKVKQRMEELIKKYKEFAKDRTRISSLRVMASEISDELTKVLKI